MNADIPADFRLYHNFRYVIKIKIHNCLNLSNSAVNVEMITSPHLFLYPPAARQGSRVAANHADSCGIGPKSKECKNIAPAGKRMGECVSYN